MKNTALRRDVTTNAFAKPRRTASRRCSEALYLLPAPPLSTSIILSIRLSRRSHAIIHFTSVSCVLHPASRVLCPVSCGLCILRPASCVRLYTLCVTIVSAMPSNHCTAPSLYCPIVSPMYLLHLFSYYYLRYTPQSNSESRSHVSCPALRILCCVLLCVRLCALFPVFVSTLPSFSCAAPCPFASSCIILYHATLRFYNFGLSCRTVIPSTTPRLFRRYSLEYNQPKVP